MTKDQPEWQVKQWDALASIQEALNTEPSTHADTFVRTLFKSAMVDWKLATKTAESPEQVYEKLKRLVEGIDWTVLARQFVADVQQRVDDLKSVVARPNNRVEGDLYSWYFADAFFLYSWIGKNYRQRIADAGVPSPKSCVERSVGTPRNLIAQPLSDAEWRVLDAASKDSTIEGLQHHSNMEMSQLLQLLTKLELVKMIRRQGMALEITELGQKTLLRSR